MIAVYKPLAIHLDYVICHWSQCDIVLTNITHHMANGVILINCFIASNEELAEAESCVYKTKTIDTSWHTEFIRVVYDILKKKSGIHQG